MYIEVRSGCKKNYVTSEHLQIGKDTIEVCQQKTGEGRNDLSVFV